MIFDLEMIKKVYGTIKAKVDRAKQICNHPLTLSEKILYSHLWNDKIKKPFIRGKDYVDFAPDTPTKAEVGTNTVSVNYGTDLQQVERTPDSSTISGRSGYPNPSLKLRVTGITST